MKTRALALHLTCIATTCVLLAGCLFKPTTVETRSFVLAPMASPTGSAPVYGHLPVGVGLVKMPPYLLRSALALRVDTNEIHYLEDARWAEPLDQSFQRALAGNLGLLLPTDQIRLSAWQRAEVAVALHVSVEQFDVDMQGRGTLIAWWRIVSPDSSSILKSGQSRLTRNGPASASNPEDIVTTLNSLTAEFSQALVQAIRESAPAGTAARQ